MHGDGRKLRTRRGYLWQLIAVQVQGLGHDVGVTGGEVLAANQEVLPSTGDRGFAGLTGP